MCAGRKSRGSFAGVESTLQIGYRRSRGGRGGTEVAGVVWLFCFCKNVSGKGVHKACNRAPATGSAARQCGTFQEH